jgi:hypothetical protein
MVDARDLHDGPRGLERTGELATRSLRKPDERFSGDDQDSISYVAKTGFEYVLARPLTPRTNRARSPAGSMPGSSG